MIFNSGILRNLLIQNGLKVTPQRLAVLEAVHTLTNHPTAEQVITYVHKKHSNIASGTIYKILDTYSEKGIVKKVKTDKDIMRYDAFLKEHHHLYCSDSDRIEDYVDIELNRILNNYFKKIQIPDFTIEDIKLQINGRFLKEK